MKRLAHQFNEITAEDLGRAPGAWRGNVKFYKLSQPVREILDYDDDDQAIFGDISYIVISAVNASFTGFETYVFPADENGTVLYWEALHGSFRGAMDHDRALQGFLEYANKLRDHED